MIEAGQLTLDVFIGKQAAWISQLIAQYGNASLSIKRFPRADMPAVRRTHAPAQQQERPVWSCSRYPDCKARCRSNPAAQARPPRARAVAAAKAPDRPRSREPCPPSAAVARVPHCPAGRLAQRLLDLCASRPAVPGRGT